MKPKEAWHKWMPSAEKLSKKYSVNSVEDIVGEFNIYLCDEESGQKICVNFYESTFIFRKTNIFYRSVELANISDEQEEFFFKEWSFFKISDSDYLYELVEESYDILNPKNFIHFVIVGSNCVVDVVAGYEPKIEFIE